MVATVIVLAMAGTASAKRPDHPVDLAKFAKDFATFKPALKTARTCIEHFRADKDGGASMDEAPAADKLPVYQKCSVELREAVTKYIKAGGTDDPEAIKQNIITPVGMSLWLAWSVVDARLGAEDILPTTDVHFRWVLANDGSEADAAAPANIANEMLDQVKAAVAAGKPEVKAFATTRSGRASRSSTAAASHGSSTCSRH